MNIRKRIGFGWAAAALLAACGGTTSSETSTSGGGGAGNVAEAWVGNWTETGTQATTCAGVTTTTQLAGPVVISLGAGTGTLRSTADGCTLSSHVTAGEATLDASQVCTVLVHGVSQTATWTKGSSTLNGNIIVGTAAGTTTSGCSFTQQSTLNRM
jgi:hypothetical protein